MHFLSLQWTALPSVVDALPDGSWQHQFDRLSSLHSKHKQMYANCTEQCTKGTPASHVSVVAHHVGDASPLEVGDV